MSSEKKAAALHDLICRMLRGNHTDKLDARALRDYLYQAGIALHNIPANVASNSPLTSDQLHHIDRLDPTSKCSDWGDWVKQLAAEFEQDLPAITKPLEEINARKVSDSLGKILDKSVAILVLRSGWFWVTAFFWVLASAFGTGFAPIGIIMAFVMPIAWYSCIYLVFSTAIFNATDKKDGDKK